MYFDRPPTDILQTNWRFCYLCATLFWGGATSQSCWGNNSGAGPHQVGSGDTDYAVLFNVPVGDAASNPQSYWHFCTLCAELYYQGPSGNRAGRCPFYGGTQGHTGGSTVYEVNWDGTY